MPTDTLQIIHIYGNEITYLWTITETREKNQDFLMIQEKRKYIAVYYEVTK